ncbi:hypothetical protein JCM8547_000896 [Rhodosporidiobolus lusitaniae]
MLEHSLPLLLRHDAALSPSTPSLIPSPPFPPPSTLSLPQTQQWIVDHLIKHNQDEGGAEQWRKGFWKRVVKGIEEGFEERRKDGDENVEDEEVHPDILERMVELLSSSPALAGAPGVSTRTYYWGELDDEPGKWQSVRTREEGRMISGGTTGLRTWQACIALSNHLIAFPSILTSSSTILELGAGIGLLSLVAARLSYSIGSDEQKTRIVATDVDEKVLEMLEGNIEQNGFSSMVRTSKLDWEMASTGAEGEVALAQWERGTFGGAGRAGLVIGADIVYDPTLTGHLAATLAYLLHPRPSSSSTASPSTSQALIAGTIRNASTWALFLSECRSRALSVEEVDLLVPPRKSGIVGAEGWEGEGEVKLVRITAA